MSLDWNLRAIHDADNLCWISDPVNYVGQRMNPITYYLIWGSMPLMLGKITTANVNEWVFRVRVYEKLYGFYLTRVTNGKPEPRLITRDDILAHIGLSCNVVSESRAKFFKRLGDRLDCDLSWERKQADREKRQRG